MRGVDPDSSAKVARTVRRIQGKESDDEPLNSISTGLEPWRRSLTTWRLPSEQALRRGKAMAGWVVDGKEEYGRNERERQDEGKAKRQDLFQPELSEKLARKKK